MAPPTPDPAADASRQALAWLHGARFLTTASELAQLPAHGLPEIAFVGRSNAGKSTAINVLTQQARLAFASRTPGRTQHINLFEVGPVGQPDALLVDLPGYGYAAVPLADKERWQRVMASYLATRANLAALVLVCDARRGIGELDLALLELVRPRVEQGLRFLLLLTKADKLGRSEQARAVAIARLQAAGGEVLAFSAPKRQGVTAAATWLWQHGRRDPRALAPPAQ